LIYGLYLALPLTSVLLWLPRVAVLPPLPLILAGALLPPAAAGASAWFLRPRPARLLGDADRRYGLKELLLTARELSAATRPLTAVDRLTLRSARAALDTVRPRRVYPLKPRIHPAPASVALLFLTITLLIAPGSGLIADGRSSGDTGKQLEERSRRIAEAAPEGAREERQIVEQLRGLARRLAERPFEEEENRELAQQLEERIRRRIAALERDLITRVPEEERAEGSGGEREGESLALRRSPAEEGRGLLVRPGEGEEEGTPSRRLLQEELEEALRELEELTDTGEAARDGEGDATADRGQGQEQPPEEPGSQSDAEGEGSGGPGNGLGEESEAGGDDGGEEGFAFAGSSPGDSAVRDRFDTPMEEQEGTDTGEEPPLRGKREGESDARISIRSPTEAGEAALPLRTIEIEYEGKLEEAMDRRRIPPEERALAGSYLYAIGADEIENSNSPE
jgi:hypothetical protein